MLVLRSGRTCTAGACCRRPRHHSPGGGDLGGAVRAPTVAATVQQAQFVWDTLSLCLLAGNNPKHPSVSPKDALLWVIYVASLGSSSCKAESLRALPPSCPPLSAVVAFLIWPGEAVQAGTLLHSRTLPEPSPGSRPTVPPWYMVIGHPQAPDPRPELSEPESLGPGADDQPVGRFLWLIHTIKFGNYRPRRGRRGVLTFSEELQGGGVNSRTPALPRFKSQLCRYG